MKKLFSLLIISIAAFIYVQTEQSQVAPPIAQDQKVQALAMPEPPERTVIVHQEEINAPVASETQQSLSNINEEPTQEVVQPSVSEPETVSQPQAPTKPTLYPIDKVEAVIFFDEDMKVVASSDVKRNLDGRPRTLEDILSTYVMYDKATNKYKIPVNEQTVDKYFSSLQQQQGLTMEQIKAMFAQGGFTYDQGRQELKMMYANNSLLQFLVESRLVVSQEMVQEYHDSHPILLESKYEIQLATITIPEGKTSADIKKQIDVYIQAGHGLPDISWSETFTMQKDDFAEDKKGIVDLDAGQIFVQETLTGFDLFKLLFKQEEGFVPLDKKRYQEIEMKIKEPLFFEIVEKVRQELLEQASIVKPPNTQALDQFNIAS